MRRIIPMSSVLLLLVFFIITSSDCFSQKKGYFHFYGGVTRSKEQNNGIFGISGGGRSGKELAYGLGIGYINLDKPYVPLTFDLSFFPQTKKFAPIAGAKAGYGIYNNKVSPVVTMKGGFTGTLFAGVALPGEKAKINVMVGGSRSSFSSKTGFSEISSFQNRLFVALGILL